MKNTLVKLLETLGYPVFLQGSLNDDECYPDNFFTFWNFENPEKLFYDNNSNRCSWGFWIYFYSISPELVETEAEKARQLLKENGYIVRGKPVDIKVDKPSHTGAFFTVYKFENY